MAKSKRNRPAHWADPDYPFPSEKNDNGETVYSVPVEANSPDAYVTLGVKKNESRRQLHVGPYRQEVVFMTTTNTAFAYDQKKWMDHIHNCNAAWNKRMVGLDGMSGPALDDEFCYSENPILMMQEDPFADLEYRDLETRIAEYIDLKHPRNAKYRIIYEQIAAGSCITDIARKMEMTPSSVDDYRKIIRVDVDEYLKKFVWK